MVCHVVDEERECILREGQAASLKALQEGSHMRSDRRLGNIQYLRSSRNKKMLHEE